MAFRSRVPCCYSDQDCWACMRPGEYVGAAYTIDELNRNAPTTSYNVLTNGMDRV